MAQFAQRFRRNPAGLSAASMDVRLCALEFHQSLQKTARYEVFCPALLPFVIQVGDGYSLTETVMTEHVRPIASNPVLRAAIIADQRSDAQVINVRLKPQRPFRRLATSSTSPPAAPCERQIAPTCPISRDCAPTTMIGAHSSLGIVLNSTLRRRRLDGLTVEIQRRMTLRPLNRGQARRNGVSTREDPAHTL